MPLGVTNFSTESPIWGFITQVTSQRGNSRKKKVNFQDSQNERLRHLTLSPLKSYVHVTVCHPWECSWDTGWRGGAGGARVPATLSSAYGTLLRSHGLY